MLKEIKLDKLYPTLKFLIIDDFESFRSSLRLMLSSFGAQSVDMASSAEDALFKCQYEFYDVILCDFNLGPGKNGQQILEELRYKKRLKHTHLFVMITAETAKDVVLGTREYQPDGYIAKPITRTVLEQRLGNLLKQQKRLKPINKEIDLGNHSKAISLCHQMMEEGEAKYKSWCRQTLAKLYSQVGDTANAEDIYNSALLGRELLWARLGLAQILNQEQRYKEAKENFEEVINNNPNIIEAYDGLSHACAQLGKNKEAQQALQAAVDLSPRMVPRQKKLGHLCQKNQDIEGAVNAYRLAVQHGENSVYKTPDNYLELSRCLSDWSEGDKSETGKKRASEAIATLDDASENFSTDESVCVKALLIGARIYSDQNHEKVAEDKLRQAESMIEEELMPADIGLELAKTLYSIGHSARAEGILKELSRRFANDPEILSRIESLMDEPEGLKERIKAKEFNKNGISLVEQNKLTDAIEAFKSAIEYTPKHAALNLNLAQVSIKQFKDSHNDQDLRYAAEALERIDHIPEQHNQYKRLQHLKGKLAKLQQTTS